MTINIFRDRFEFIAFCVIEIQMKTDEPQGCYLNERVLVVVEVHFTSNIEFPFLHIYILVISL